MTEFRDLALGFVVGSRASELVPSGFGCVE